MNEKKMAISTYLLPIESKKINSANKNRDRIIDMERVLMVARWEGWVQENG